MRHALLVCVKDLRQRLRDRTAIVIAIGAPLALTLLLGSALGGCTIFRQFQPLNTRARS
jgi:hypothetical protein